MKTLSNIAIINNKEKENTWYLNIAAAMYMTYNLNFYIIPDLDHQTTKIKIIKSTILKI